MLKNLQKFLARAKKAESISNIFIVLAHPFKEKIKTYVKIFIG